MWPHYDTDPLPQLVLRLRMCGVLPLLHCILT